MNTLITCVDRIRINSCLEMLPSGFRRGTGIRSLMQRIRVAVAVEPGDIPANCVTMNTRLRLRYQATGEVRDLRLVYPNRPEGDGLPDPVSVISPVGAALLGSRAGDVIEWEAPSGPQTGEVMAILYQPEAHGDPA